MDAVFHRKEGTFVVRSTQGKAGSISGGVPCEDINKCTLDILESLEEVA
jgi:hypothetical protein